MKYHHILCFILSSILISYGYTATAHEKNAQNHDAITTALNHPDRPTLDRPRDKKRKPAEVLKFFGIKPDMKVADMMAGGGWYSEILSRIVGPKGHVYVQNNKTSNRVYGSELKKRLSTSKLSNITHLVRELENPGFPANTLDALLMIQFYHDTYWMGDDRAMMNQKIFDALKSGGVYCIIDHQAQAKSGDRDTKSLHRVDSELVKQEILDAGFILEAESQLLRNSSDDHSVNVFELPIKGKTDRFIFKFRKP